MLSASLVSAGVWNGYQLLARGSDPVGEKNYDTGYKRPENYWVFGLCPSSGILENTMFRKLDLFPLSGEGGGEDTSSVGPLRKS
jgi:hypothetical protein